MPTTLPKRPPALKTPLWFICWMVAIYLASTAIEVVDPTPMDVNAAITASP